MPELDEDASQEEQERRRWNEQFLLELGVSPIVAEAFRDDVDPHLVAKLIRRGCPPDVAVHIVR